MRRAFVVGRSTETNVRLAAAFAERGYQTNVGALCELSEPEANDVVLGRLDVLPTLDGVEDGLWALIRPRRKGATVLNQPDALLSAHDKLATALLLGRSGVPQPRTAHVREPKIPAALTPPYVVKPRFGSWGRDVFRSATPAELLACMCRLAHRRWFRKHGAIVQELVPATGFDLRVVVACGEVVGAAERAAAPGEWKTNIALGGLRRSVDPPNEACVTALRAAAALDIDLAGVDLVVDSNGSWLVLEVNGAVDFTDEYGLSGLDPFLAAVDALTEARAGRALALEA